MTQETKLFNKNFILLWLGQSVSSLGSGAGFIAVMWWVQVETGSALALGTLAMSKGLVAFGFSPFAGALADRWNRKAIIVLTDIIRGAIFLLMGVLAFRGALTFQLVLGLEVLSSAVYQLFNPAISAVLPQVVPRQRLDSANSLRQFSKTTVNILSFAVGGIFISLIGVPLLFVIDGVSFIISALSEMFITIPKLPKAQEPISAINLLSDVKAGYRYVKENTILFRIISIAIIINLFLTPYLLLMPKFVDEHLQAGSEVYGYIMGAQMSGALLAALAITLTSFFKRNYKIIKWGIVIQSGFLVALPLLPTSSYLPHLAIMFGQGIAMGMVDIYFHTMLQHSSSSEYLGKVYGLVGMMDEGVRPIAQGLAGVAASFVALPIVYLVSAILSGLSGLGFVKIPGIDGFISSIFTAKPRVEKSSSV